MSEISIPENESKPSKKATENKPHAPAHKTATPKNHDIDDKNALDKIRGDLARFNLNLTGQNEPWQPTKESGLPMAPEPTPDAELAQELKNPIKIKDPKTGQEFSTLQLNWKKRETLPADQPVLVFLTAFNDQKDKGAVHYRIQEVARQGGMPMMALDHPSMGSSDKLTSEQRKSLSGDEGYGKIAEAELRAMKELGITDIDLVGQSMGAFAAAELAKKAAEIGIKVKNLILVEAPGVEGVSITELGKRFGAEGKYLDTYLNHPYDPQQLEAVGQSSTLVRTAKIAKDTLKPDSIRYGNAMAKETIYDRLNSALTDNPDLKVTVVNGTLSGVSPAKATREMIKKLGEDGFGGRVRHMVFQGEPHTFMESAKRLGSLTKLVVSQPKAA